MLKFITDTNDILWTLYLNASHLMYLYKQIAFQLKSNPWLWSVFHYMKLWAQDILQNRCCKNILDCFGFGKSPTHGPNLAPSSSSYESWQISPMWVWACQELLQPPVWFYGWDYSIWGRVCECLMRHYGELCSAVQNVKEQQGWLQVTAPQIAESWRTAINLGLPLIWKPQGFSLAFTPPFFLPFHLFSAALGT